MSDVCAVVVSVLSLFGLTEVEGEGSVVCRREADDGEEVDNVIT